jgi:hypothetical protein
VGSFQHSEKQDLTVHEEKRTCSSGRRKVIAKAANAVVFVAWKRVVTKRRNFLKSVCLRSEADSELTSSQLPIDIRLRLEKRAAVFLVRSRVSEGPKTSSERTDLTSKLQSRVVDVV